MTIVFYRYKNICEPDIAQTFHNLGIDVIEKIIGEEGGNSSISERIEYISSFLETTRPVFVFSINFFPIIADICHIHKILYLCWTVDSPILELFSKSIQHNTNRIFMFDRAQYEYFRSFNPDCIFYLPLASATERLDKVTSSVSRDDQTRYHSDISFVGSLYTEHNPMHTISLPDYVSGYINAMVAASLKIYGYNFMEEVLTDEIIDNLREADPSLFSFPNTITDPSRYVAANHYIARQTAETERIRTLNELARHFSVDLYTGSDPSLLCNVHVHDKVNTLNEMPKVFHLSKINLNMTIRSIQTGLPLRIFDILGCGGFLMTNYQSELSEYFEIGTDLEAYSSLEELVDKCSYYLSHDDKRKQIAVSGYQKVKENHSYQKRVLDMLRISAG